MSERRVNNIYKVINKPLTIMGAARDLFFLSAVLGAGIFNLFGSLVGGLLIFLVGVFAGRYATQKDPQIIRILLTSQKFRKQYDPMKFSNEQVVLEE